MPHPSDLPPVDLLDQTEPLSPGARLGWWGGYVFLVLVAFCFGVWTGTQKPKPVEAVVAPAPTPGEKPPEQPPEPKKELTPELKKAPEVKAPGPKKTPEVVTPEPKKTSEPPEVKKTPEPKATPMVKEVLFVKDVQPIFKAKCNSCHGDAKSVGGALDTRNLQAILKGGDSGPGVKARDPDASPIWTEIEGGSMPKPGGGREPLTDAEKAVVRNWILSGAK